MIKIVNSAPLPSFLDGFGKEETSTYHVHKVGHFQSSQDSRRNVPVVVSELGVQQDKRCEFTKP